MQDDFFVNVHEHTAEPPVHPHEDRQIEEAETPKEPTDAERLL